MLAMPMLSMFPCFRKAGTRVLDAADQEIGLVPDPECGYDIAMPSFALNAMSKNASQASQRVRDRHRSPRR